MLFRKGGPGDSITIQVLYIQSVNINHDLFIASLLESHVSIIVFTEPWLYSSNENLLGIPGYRALFSSNDNYRAGGVAVFVREDLVAHKISIEAAACDVLMVEIIVGALKLNLVAIYRSPTSAVSDIGAFISSDLRGFLKRLSREPECLLLGDINICLLRQSASLADYLKLICSSGFQILNDSTPTRVAGDSSTLIDHVIAKLKRFTVRNIEIVDSMGVSDHKLINLVLGCPAVLHPRKFHRKVDYEKLVRNISQYYWSICYNLETPSAESEAFSDACRASLDACTVLCPINPTKDASASVSREQFRSSGG